MNRWAQVSGDTVVTVVEQGSRPSTPGNWVSCPDSVGPGARFVAGEFSPATTQEDTSFYVDVGPFFDRFEASVMAVLTTTDPAIKAWITNVNIRKWIWTKHPSIGQAIDAMIALGIPGVDAAMKARIQNTPARWSEQSALIKLYFPEQEVLAKIRK